MDTKTYRQQQFEKIATADSEYKPGIKIIRADEETNWLNITEHELACIIALLTGQESD